MVLMEKGLRRKGLFCECFVRGRSGRVDEAFSGEQTKYHFSLFLSDTVSLVPWFQRPKAERKRQQKENPEANRRASGLGR